MLKSERFYGIGVSTAVKATMKIVNTEIFFKCTSQSVEAYRDNRYHIFTVKWCTYAAFLVFFEVYSMM